MACWNCSNLKQQYVLPQNHGERRCWKPKLRPHCCNFLQRFLLLFLGLPGSLSKGRCYRGNGCEGTQFFECVSVRDIWQKNKAGLDPKHVGGKQKQEIRTTVPQGTCKRFLKNLQKKIEDQRMHEHFHKACCEEHCETRLRTPHHMKSNETNLHFFSHCTCPLGCEDEP